VGRGFCDLLHVGVAPGTQRRQWGRAHDGVVRERRAHLGGCPALHHCRAVYSGSHVAAQRAGAGRTPGRCPSGAWTGAAPAALCMHTLCRLATCSWGAVAASEHASWAGLGHYVGGGASGRVLPGMCLLRPAVRCCAWGAVLRRTLGCGRLDTQQRHAFGRPAAGSSVSERRVGEAGAHQPQGTRVNQLYTLHVEHAARVARQSRRSEPASATLARPPEAPAH